MPNTGMGGNNPPDMTVTADETTKALSDWLKDHPVIEDESTVREAKVYVDRAKLCIKDLEDERDKAVRPFNEKVKEINGYYKNPRTILERVSQELSQRVSSFLRAEELRRIEAANSARRVAEEAERAAREAERIEQEAFRNAAAGELDIDTQAVTMEANDAFRDYERAARAAALAEKESHVKIRGGFSRAISLRSKETLTVTNPMAALQVIGATEAINEAIVKSARAYRKLHGQLPEGVQSTIIEEI